MQMRVSVLYLLDKRILALMISAFIVAEATAGTILGVILSKVTGEILHSGQLAASLFIYIRTTAITFDLNGNHYCLPIGLQTWFYTYWIPLITFETLLCCLAVFKGFSSSRTGRFNLFNLLIRDSVLYYIILVASYVAAMVIWICEFDYLEAPIAFTVTMSCVLGNRLVFNIRRQVCEDRQTLSSGGFSQSNIQSPITSGERGRFRLEAGQVSSTTKLSDMELMELRQLRPVKRDLTFAL
ncbi:hypothetical protein FISHEDRAFT_73668 [Fistulina hepatica ATCC 64428]|uniref:Uncharacterized protein n=1 Tax=Fistulina hepatica ATCC 64428 TaxID=1128425 RepID=A0A0D7ABU9_9AGAR|nr:hypothetical protein FISHEDRAFT_73668 [Fistulina hepatica ATCC 64428]